MHHRQSYTDTHSNMCMPAPTPSTNTKQNTLAQKRRVGVTSGLRVLEAMHCVLAISVPLFDASADCCHAQACSQQCSHQVVAKLEKIMKCSWSMLKLHVKLLGRTCTGPLPSDTAVEHHFCCSQPASAYTCPWPCSHRHQRGLALRRSPLWHQSAINSLL